MAKAPLTFLIVMGALLLALSWLGWLLLAQDHSLRLEKTRNRVEAAAEGLSGALQLRVQEELANLENLAKTLESETSSETGSMLQPESARGLTVHFARNSMIVVPENSLRYVPMQATNLSTSEAFKSADHLEFRQGGVAEAIKLLEALARSPERAIQAGARLRLGRIFNRSGDIDRAIEELGLLSGFNDLLLENVPAQWLALYARCKIFAENDQTSFALELKTLADLLGNEGRQVSKATYRFYAEAVNGWLSETPTVTGTLPLPTSHSLSDAVSELHYIWTERIQGRGDVNGMLISRPVDDSLILMWSSYDSQMLGRVLNLGELHQSGLMRETKNLEGEGLGWSIGTTNGWMLLNSSESPVAAASVVTLTIGDLPLTVQAFETAGLVPMPEDVQRRQLLLAGLAVVLIVILSSTYFILRALRREAQIAELQSDFVAAVSHEFRTPLTSIRQLIELLASGRVREQEKIDDYYRILDKESARLQRMVEELLDFRLMEANAKPYRPEKLNMGDLLEEIIATFREEYRLEESALKLEVTGDQYVMMDRESLVRAVWNLLDNAAKYSDAQPQISVSNGSKNGTSVTVISDCGIGISKEDQSRVFRKFVRGDAAKVTNAKGTGMGLAMVRKILEDQGAMIGLESEPGLGSTFTIEIEMEGEA
ncbi:MAG: two-component system phosphate regulon sensor histidine kinase PhoR [Lysobacterales bacterium]|jgi:two-component system phosphate regulon sensor histidine kinase PhoR